jgi:hypothetical protein
MQKQCAWQKMKGKDGERGAGATRKAFVLNKYNLRKGSNNVGENQKFTKCFQFKALARRLCKGMRAWKKEDLIALY